MWLGTALEMRLGALTLRVEPLLLHIKTKLLRWLGYLVWMPHSSADSGTSLWAEIPGKSQDMLEKLRLLPGNVSGFAQWIWGGGQGEESLSIFV